MEKYPITKLHGHDLQILEYTDGTARLTLDGLLVTDPALCEAIGIPEATFDLFFRQYANGKGGTGRVREPGAGCHLCHLSGRLHQCTGTREKARLNACCGGHIRRRA